MQQLTQKLSNGEMEIQELPLPKLQPGMIMVKNHYSLISAGTEGATVRTARKSMLGKAKEKPQQVKQVIDKLKTQGIKQTYRAVMKKLDAYSPLGYSCAGEVISVADDVLEFKVGDKVACAGAGYANHAEVVTVPINLCVKLRPDANMMYACYNTVGAIALQGVRQADLRLGETCAVIGLGLIGQIVCMELKASGVNVIGIDVSEDAVKLAQDHCADVAIKRDTPGIEQQIDRFTNGVGVDGVIITAATSSLDPINFAGSICRRKGVVVVLGAVPTGFDREPFYYKKELELKMSCSYGPGRYDLNYEEKGLDYPVEYVRWTEKRNMEAFQNLIYKGKINLDYLTTHKFVFDDAPKAYDIVLNHTEPYKGIVLEYDITKSHQDNAVVIDDKSIGMMDGGVNIAFIGAGSYAQGLLLPNLPKDIGREVVMTSTGTTAKRVAEKFKFRKCTSSADDIFKDDNVNTVFVTTRHNTHADYVIESLKAHKNVYVEKPLCLNLDELNVIEELCKQNHVGVMIGFNRRFSPLASFLKSKLPEGPMSMIYRINAGEIPASSWIQDRNIGGGRIIGEVCHFIDFMTFFCGSDPCDVEAMSMDDSRSLNDTVIISVRFKNGSIGTIAYYSNGSKSLSKEYFEVYSAGSTGYIDDFKACKYFGKKVETKRLAAQDKGQSTMIKLFFEQIRNGELPIPLHEIFAVTKATFAAEESIKSNSALISLE